MIVFLRMVVPIDAVERVLEVRKVLEGLVATTVLLTSVN
jgi:hypothetical protein